ncbi:DNA polymerase beta superfamily protein [Halosolutus amylolyticus]|uniref:DNA polymerase beta superfamily protein n=1 Tax=Halosolutus amylolyticus TaxID=2932267 RepID=A0ABD5PUS3_9EURY|nr:nucleotidyltransferase domain-containing protein [Halosolutus amylolyticus]
MTSVPQQVHETVAAHLDAIERRHDVTVAFAAARGSHAWGAAAPDSDYDVGFVFVPTDLRVYVHLDGPDDVITSDRGEFEYQGWDVRTVASLLADSNDGAIDLLRSPIRYRSAYDPDDLRAYVERTYNPIDLYHAWRGIAMSNYRKYLSDHLVRTDDAIFPIVEERDDEYVVETDDGPTTIDRDDDRYAQTRTRPTVKRNLTICRAAMSARYLKATGERGGHDLPALDVGRFLTEQAPAVFDEDRIALATDLLERKRRGEGAATIGDAVGREFARPPREIDPAIHARDGPDHDRLDAFVDEMIGAVQ